MFELTIVKVTRAPSAAKNRTERRRQRMGNELYEAILGAV